MDSRAHAMENPLWLAPLALLLLSAAACGSDESSSAEPEPTGGSAGNGEGGRGDAGESGSAGNALQAAGTAGAAAPTGGVAGVGGGGGEGGPPEPSDPCASLTECEDPYSVQDGACANSFGVITDGDELVSVGPGNLAVLGNRVHTAYWRGDPTQTDAPFTMALRYGTWNGTAGWSFETVGSYDLDDAPARVQAWLYEEDGGTVVVSLPRTSGGVGWPLLLYNRMEGTTWLPTEMIVDDHYDGTFDLAYADVAGTPMVLTYTSVYGTWANERVAFVLERQTDDTWARTRLDAVGDGGGWAPFLFENQGRAECLTGASTTLYWSRRDSDGVWSAENIADELGLEELATRGDASATEGGTLLIGPGQPAFLVRDGVEYSYENLKYAWFTGTRWRVEFVDSVGPVSENGGIAIENGSLGLQCAQPFAVYSIGPFGTATQQPGMGPPPTRLARRRPGGQWDVRALLRDGALHAASVPVGNDYAFVTFSKPDEALENHYFAYLCVSDRCPAPACDDGSLNGTETDTDCGGAICPACAEGQHCIADEDCTTLACDGGRCKPE